MAIEIVSFPIENMVILHSFLNVYQRVKPPFSYGFSYDFPIKTTIFL
jgi:hypothetical protein